MKRAIALAVASAAAASAAATPAKIEARASSSSSGIVPIVTVKGNGEHTTDSCEVKANNVLMQLKSLFRR